MTLTKIQIVESIQNQVKFALPADIQLQNAPAKRKKALRNNQYIQTMEL